MVLNKNLTNTNRGKGMKTFKQHIKEGSDKTAAAVGSQTTNSVEDGSIGVHNIALSGIFGACLKKLLIPPSITSLLI